jgi:2-keto-3-deoxy-L-rhamnonate aldolase RhmA
MDEYIELANEATIVAIQIEHIDGVDSIDEILAVPGIDIVLLGPMDLSASLGLLGKLEHPEVIDAMQRVVDAARRVGLPVGIPMPADATGDEMLEWVTRGCRFVIVGLDQGFVQMMAANTLVEFRQRLEA